MVVKFPTSFSSPLLFQSTQRMTNYVTSQPLLKLCEEIVIDSVEMDLVMIMYSHFNKKVKSSTLVILQITPATNVLASHLDPSRIQPFD